MEFNATVEYFIDRVKCRPCLWNQHHVSHRDVMKKDLSWERIAKECGLANGKEAKMQWKKLRDSHREALRRRKPTNGQTAQFLRPWKYEEDMKFVVNLTESKDTSNNAVEDIDDTIVDNSSRELPEPKLVRFNHKSSSTIDPSNIDRDKKRELTEFLEERDQLMQAVALSRADPLSKYFDSLCAKTRELPKYLQLRVQRQIFESVTLAEEEAFSLNTSHPGDDITVSEVQQDYTDNEYERKFSVESP